jgi:hypothetical protein
MRPEVAQQKPFIYVKLRAWPQADYAKLISELP